MQTLNGTKRLYQFGSYVFLEANFSVDMNTSAKIQLANPVGLNGSIRLNGDEADTIEDQNITVSFLAKDEDSVNTLQYEFFGKPKKIFFVHYKSEKEIEILFNYATCTSIKGQGYSSDDPLNNEFTATFRIMTPFLYRCLDNLYLLDSELYPASDRGYWGDGITTWQTSGTIWGDTDKLGVNLEYHNQKYELMNKYFGCNCDFGYPLLYFDAYFKKEIQLPTLAGTFDSFNLATTPILTQTKTFTTPLDGNYVNNIILLKIIASMQQNDWIQIDNQDDDTNVRLTWLDPNPAGSPNLVLSLYDFELYDLTNGNTLIKDISKYRIDVLGKDILSIESHWKSFLDPYFPPNQNIKISTGNQGTIQPINGSLQLYNLPTYLI
jgi:hypothetical protein